MKSFYAPRVASALLLVSIASVTHANDTDLKRCKTINWKPGIIIPVEATMYKQTHVTLPEEALDVVWGTKELWDNDFIKNNIWFKPLNSQPQGAETTATAIGNSLNSYEFEVTRVPKLKIHCVYVVATGGLIQRSNWDSKDTLQQAQVQLLQQQLARANTEKAQANVEAQRQAQEAVKSYRSSISSNYEWSKGDGWFAESAVESVHDDGRFTYIRLKTDSRGIMSVLAEIDGKTEILEKVYDATKHEYRIAGIYPKFILRAGNSEVTVTRRN